MSIFTPTIIFPKDYAQPATNLARLDSLVASADITYPSEYARDAFTNLCTFVQERGHTIDTRESTLPLDVYSWPLEAADGKTRCEIIVVTCIIEPESEEEKPYQAWFFNVYNGPAAAKRSRAQQEEYEGVVDGASEIAAEQVPHLLYEAFAPTLHIDD